MKSKQMKRNAKYRETSLEVWADRTLRQLPDRQAPVSLAPGILAAIRRAGNLPWYRKSWTEWPAFGKWLSLVIGVLGLALLVLGMPAGVNHFSAPLVSAASQPIDRVASLASTCVSATGLVARSVPTHAYSIGFGIFLIGWLVTAISGTCCWKLLQSQPSAAPLR